jgi:hypothetical protein
MQGLNTRALGSSQYRRRPVYPLPLVLTFPSRGMGALAPQQSSIASAAASGAAATGALIGALAAIPIAGPIAAAIAGIGVAIANIFSGCGQTCVQATTIANQVGDALTENLNQYLSAPVHYASLQAAAINNFNTAWNALVQSCSNPALQSAGQACITDRQRGACTWKASPGGWQQNPTTGAWTYVPWGPNGSGTACWNYFVGLLDPIANDPTVVPDPVPGSTSSAGLLQSVGINPSTTIAGLPVSDLVLPVGLLALWWLFS